MLDDIIEAVIDIAGDILEAVIVSRRKRTAKPKQRKTVRQDDPWTHSDQAAPWEK